MRSQTLHPLRVLQQIKTWDHISQVQNMILFMTLLKTFQQVFCWVHISQCHNAIPSITPSQSFAINKELGSHFTGSQCNLIHDTVEKHFNTRTAGFTFHRFTMQSQTLHLLRVLQQIKSWDHISQVHNVILFMTLLKNFSTSE